MKRSYTAIIILGLITFFIMVQSVFIVDETNTAIVTRFGEPIKTSTTPGLNFKIPFVCGARDLGEALRRISEGAAMIRTKGEAGSGNIVEAVRHMRTVMSQIKRLTTLGSDELVAEAKDLGAPLSLVQQVSKLGKLPVPNFAAGGIATPADASLMMQLGAESVFVGSGIFKSDDPDSRANAIVKATTHYQDATRVAEASSGLKKAMKGLDMSEIPEEERLQERGW